MIKSRTFFGDHGDVVTTVLQEGREFFIVMTYIDPLNDCETFAYSGIMDSDDFDEWKKLARVIYNRIAIFLDATDNGCCRKPELVKQLPDGEDFDEFSSSALFSFEGDLLALIGKAEKGE